MDKKYNILFFHPSGLFYGGTEKLLQIMAKHATERFNVFFAYAPKDGENRKSYFESTSVKLLPFSYSRKQGHEPFKLLDMQPAILEIINSNHIDCVCLPVYCHYQFPVNVLPASMPLILTSPFGHYCSNGNVQKVFVSGRENLERLKSRGIKNAELVYDPLEDFDSRFLEKSNKISTVVFGRVGRADDNIFDAVSIRAFARLERKYGDAVKYLVLTPPPKMVQTVNELGVKNFVIADDKDADYLGNFYQQTDVLAHARKDGETFGKAIAEAMLAGLPIITHRSHYHNEHLNFINPDFAKWSEPDDVDGYYKNMAWFVENRLHIRPMGQLARQKALELFGVEKIMPHILDEFENACGNCSYYLSGSKFSGYTRLWLNNLKILPYIWAKRLVFSVKPLKSAVEKIYFKHPLY